MIAGIILAAGSSQRLGHRKQLVAIDGTPLVCRAARAALDSCERVAVVLGAFHDAIAPALAGLPVTLVANPAWSEGMASSIRAGLAWAAADARVTAVLLAVCDQIDLDAAHLARLIAAYRDHGEPVGSAYAGIIGVPAVFPRAAFGALLALAGDRGARGLLVAARSVDWPAGARDLDEPISPS